MKIYKVKVNNKVYEVELESVTESNNKIEMPVAMKSEAPVLTAKSAGGTDVLAPMQGNILKIIVKEGAVIQKNQAVVILEAMKLENEIYAPISGKIGKIYVTPGQTVNNKQLLFTIE